LEYNIYDINIEHGTHSTLDTYDEQLQRFIAKDGTVREAKEYIICEACRIHITI
jgi:hypothetical protein